MKVAFWLGAAWIGLVLAQSCGAMTLEPLPPEEPLPEAAPPPRLLRKDAEPPPAAPSEEP
jgi:hypothetical protein